MLRKEVNELEASLSYIVTLLPLKKKKQFGLILTTGQDLDLPRRWASAYPVRERID